MKKFCLVVILFILLFPMFAVDNSVTIGINLLNEFTYYSTLVKMENNRIGLNSLYDDLLNNYSPKNIDSATNDRMIDILNTITGLKIIDLKRERLDILYDFKKSLAIQSAIPSPLMIIGTVKNIGESIGYFYVGDYVQGTQKAIQGVTMLATTISSSVTMYNSSKNLLVSEYLKESYELDYQQMRQIDSLRSTSFKYQNEYAHTNGVEDDYVLNEQLAEKFAECIVEPNKGKALDYLSSRIEIYKYFPRFWLELADLYYQNGNYVKCIDTIEYYNSNFDYKQIYKKNIRYGQILVEGIASALETIHDESLLKARVLPWLDIIVTQTADDDWYQRYFCAMTYLLFADDSEQGKDFLKKAYDLLKMNVNTLYEKQKKLNDDYIEDIKEPSKDDYKKMTNTQGEETKAWYKNLKEERKGLPQMNPAFIENLLLVIRLIQEYKIGSISDIAYVNEVILSPQLQAYISGAKYEEGNLFGYEEKDFKLNMKWLVAFGNHIELTIPVVFLNDCSRVYLKYDNQTEYTEFWNPQSKELNDNSLKEVSIGDVSRKGTDVEKYTVTLSFDLLEEWKKNATDSDGFECYVMLETNGCPLELFFAGSSAFNCDLISMKKNYNDSQTSFYSSFDKIRW